MTSQLNPYASSSVSTGIAPFGAQPYMQQQSYSPFGGPGIGGPSWGLQSQQNLQPLQQIVQLLQVVPQQLQQIQQLVQIQLQHLQQFGQIVPQQLHQLQQLIQFVPQQLQQLQQQIQAQQSYGQSAGLQGLPGSPQFTNPFGWSPTQHVM